jgi:anti-sigma factor RsiW
MLFLGKKEMICLANNKQNAGILLDYGAGTLAPEKAAELERHAQPCADCRRMLAAQREVGQSLDLFSVPEVSAGFDQRLYARIAQEGVPSWRSRLWDSFGLQMPLWKPALAGAMACVLLAAGLFMGLPGLVKLPSSGDLSKQRHFFLKSNSVERVDIEQVEQSLEDLDLLAPQPAPSSVM